MTSVERIVEYSQLPSESLEKGRVKASEEWPSKGRIQFKEVCLRYDESSGDVLKDLSIDIEPCEKVGIIGRTGAGKSSLIQTLLRLYEPSGSILIDEINIKDLSLHELRSRLTIIPVSICTRI